MELKINFQAELIGFSIVWLAAKLQYAITNLQLTK